MGGSNPPPPSPGSHMPVMQPQLPLTGGQEQEEEEGEEGRAATLLSPVAASASPLLLPSQPAEPPAGHGDMAPASGLSCHIRPQMSGPQSANVVPVWESGKERGGRRRSGCCSVTVGGCSPAPGESGSARERRIFPPDLSGSSSSAASFCSTDDGQRKMPSSMKRSYQPSQWQFSGQR